MYRLIAKTLSAGALTLALLGCEQKLTYSRFEAIQTGDPADAVQSILGKPNMREERTWVYSDHDRQIMALVYFQDGKVIGKEWRDPEHGMQGKDPYVNQPGDSHEVRFRETR